MLIGSDILPLTVPAWFCLKDDYLSINASVQQLLLFNTVRTDKAEATADGIHERPGYV